MTKQLQAVILDWAGTTMDYGCMAPMVVFKVVYKEMGVPITTAEARGPMGAHKRVHIYQISQMESVRERWHKAHGSYPNENDVDEMFAMFQPKQLECLAEYSKLIPGTLEAVEEFRRRELKIGSTTGYTGEMMEVLLELAAAQGYMPDVSVCSTGRYAVLKDGVYEFGQVQGQGKDWNMSRPKPDMCNLNAKLLKVEDPSLVVKVGDTLPDIEEGLNAGMWTSGLMMTGNEIGLPEKEVKALGVRSLDAKLRKAHFRLKEAGAHYVVDGIWQVPDVVDQINERIAKGERP